jgi:hypothetical protein
VSDGTDLRTEFLLDPDVTFLNHGSFGACPRAVFERYQEWQLELERQPVLFLARRHEELLGEARAALGAYVGADPDDLVFVPNATAGVNVAARALGLEPGDDVLSTDLEYGALDLTWEHVCAELGARYVRTPIRLPVESAEEIVDAVWAGVGPRTRVLFLSHHTSVTALTLPVEELCRRARERGIRTVVDGAHAPGHLPLDLRALDSDFYAGNCHKWQFHFSETRGVVSPMRSQVFAHPRGASRGSADYVSRRYGSLVVARRPEPSHRPVNEDEAGEDRIPWYWPEGAAVLRDAAVVAEDVVLLRPEMGRGKGVGWEVVGLASIDEDASVATDHSVTGDANHTLGEVEITCMRVRCDRAAKLATGVNDDDLSPMRVAKVVREALGESATVTCRERWSHACSLAPDDQHDQARCVENHKRNNERENSRDRDQEALAA